MPSKSVRAPTESRAVCSSSSVELSRANTSRESDGEASTAAPAPAFEGSGAIADASSATGSDGGPSDPTGGTSGRFTVAVAAASAAAAVATVAASSSLLPASDLGGGTALILGRMGPGEARRGKARGARGAGDCSRATTARRCSLMAANQAPGPAGVPQLRCGRRACTPLRVAPVCSAGRWASTVARKSMPEATKPESAGSAMSHATGWPRN